jgi:molecular chaperone DnaK
MSDNEIIIGIDLGTSNSAAAVLINGKPTVIPSAEGPSLHGKAFPSYVAFANGERLVGESAKRQAVTNPKNTIMGIKREMGTDYKVNIEDKQYTPQEISAFILQKIKKDAENFLEEEVKKAVITVPAYFDDNQRTATKDAGTIAGLNVVRLINEPTAASLAYGINKQPDNELKLMVYDFGGGTLDVTIMEFGNGLFKVLSTSGDTKLGGTDMDNLILNYLSEEFKKETDIDLTDNDKAVQRVREASEKAKIELSTVMETEINLPFIAIANGEPKDLVFKLTRAKLEELVSDIIEKSQISIDQALKDAKISKTDIDKIILVGGPTRMQSVQKFVESYIGKTAERGIDSMEAVATGAAIQGSIVGREIANVVLLDVTPLSLGTEVVGGITDKLIEKNTPVPVKKSKIYTTIHDNQTEVHVHILQGERRLTKDNISLGEFLFSGIPPALKGIPRIETTFSINENGILNVSAQDQDTGKEKTITINSSNKLSETEIKQKIKEAKQYAEEDKKREEVIKIKNEAESLIYDCEKILKNSKYNITDNEKINLEEQIKLLRDAILSEHIVNMKKRIEELKNILNPIKS